MKKYLQFLESISNKPSTDSDGNPIKNPQEFWKWFGDSKIIDNNGRPLVVYHGTRDEFNTFNTSDAYFSAHKDVSIAYGQKLMKAYICIKNPYVFDWTPYRDEDGKYWYLDKHGEIVKRRYVSRERTGYEIDITYATVIKSELNRRGFDGAISDYGWGDRIRGFEEIAVFFPKKQIRIIK